MDQSIINPSSSSGPIYIGTDRIAAAPFVRPSLGEEANRLYHAANIMYWAKALLKLTYDYIDRAIDNADEAPPF